MLCGMSSCIEWEEGSVWTLSVSPTSLCDGCCRPDLLFRNWEDWKDLFVDVAGSSLLWASNVDGFVARGAAWKAVARKEAPYRSILLAQPPSVANKNRLVVFHIDASAILARFKREVNLAALSHDD